MIGRSSAGGLILTLAVFTGLGVAGTLVHFKPCQGCGGLAQYILERTSPSVGSVQRPRIGCPDCADRGKVSLFRSWIGPRVAPSIAALVRGFTNPNAAATDRALGVVVQDSGPAYARFLGQMPPHRKHYRDVEFVEAEQKLYLVLIAEWGKEIDPVSAGIFVILLSAEGRALDFVDVSSTAWGGYFSGKILADEAQVTIQRRIQDPPKEDLLYRMTRWDGSAREIRVRTSEICRLAIRGDRFEVEVPPPK